MESFVVIKNIFKSTLLFLMVFGVSDSFAVTLPKFKFKKPPVDYMKHINTPENMKGKVLPEGMTAARQAELLRQLNTGYGTLGARMNTQVKTGGSSTAGGTAAGEVVVGNKSTTGSPMKDPSASSSAADFSDAFHGLGKSTPDSVGVRNVGGADAKYKFDMMSAMAELNGITGRNAEINNLAQSLDGNDLAFGAVMKSFGEMDSKSLNTALSKFEGGSPSRYGEAFRKYLDQLTSNEKMMIEEPKKVFELSKQVLENYDLQSLESLNTLRSTSEGRLVELKSKGELEGEAKKFLKKYEAQQKAIDVEISKWSGHLRTGSKSGFPVKVKEMVKGQLRERTYTKAELEEKLAGGAKAREAVGKSIAELQGSLDAHTLTPSLAHGAAFETTMKDAIARSNLRGKLDTDSVIRDTLERDHLMRACGGAG